MRFSVIVAARIASRRLPGKALLPLCGMPMIRLQLRRLLGTRLAEHVVLATTQGPDDDQLAEEARGEGVPVFRGAGEDVVSRLDDAALALGSEYVVRVTGDCPFTDAETLDHCLRSCEAFGPFDLATTKTAFPVGIDYEIYRAESLRRLHADGRLSVSDREHVTQHFYAHPQDYRIHRIDPRPEWKYDGRRFTIDTAEDYREALALASAFSDPHFTVGELVLRAEAMA